MKIIGIETNNNDTSNQNVKTRFWDHIDKQVYYVLSAKITNYSPESSEDKTITLELRPTNIKLNLKEIFLSNL